MDVNAETYLNENPHEDSGNFGKMSLVQEYHDIMNAIAESDDSTNKQSPPSLNSFEDIYDLGVGHSSAFFNTYRTLATNRTP